MDGIGIGIQNVLCRLFRSRRRFVRTADKSAAHGKHESTAHDQKCQHRAEYKLHVRPILGSPSVITAASPSSSSRTTGTASSACSGPAPACIAAVAARRTRSRISAAVTARTAAATASRCRTPRMGLSACTGLPSGFLRIFKIVSHTIYIYSLKPFQSFKVHKKSAARRRRL